ncbi:MAG: DUF5320 domain-containing protein [Candidatus Desulfofervidaceae bacterium]|nr:DUF5320 domain-containing protein [Candidatus Desulfofervidaceae bacterium]MDL1970742.1 DUF5320 domain-containing protein [Candidatus Desulfofervidaceae bacterium]
MPRLNGTGPLGMGPMTGRGLGYCPGVIRPGIPPAGYATIPYYGRGWRRGFGRGRGAGRGFGRGFGQRRRFW